MKKRIISFTPVSRDYNTSPLIDTKNDKYVKGNSFESN